MPLGSPNFREIEEFSSLQILTPTRGSEREKIQILLREKIVLLLGKIEPFFVTSFVWPYSRSMLNFRPFEFYLRVVIMKRNETDNCPSEKRETDNWPSLLRTG